MPITWKEINLLTRSLGFTTRLLLAPFILQLTVASDVYLFKTSTPMKYSAGNRTEATANSRRQRKYQVLHFHFILISNTEGGPLAGADLQGTLI